MNSFELVANLLLPEAIKSLAEFGINWLFQSTLLISIGLVVGRLLQKHGSALQSVVYRTTLAAVLVCPLVTLGLAACGVSGWSLSLPDAWVVNSDPANRLPVESEAELGVGPSNQPAEFGNGSFAVDRFDDDFFGDSNRSSDNSLAGEMPESIDESDDLESATLATLDTSQEVSASSSGYGLFVGLVSIATIVWSLITLFLIARLAIAWWLLSRLRLSAVRAEAELSGFCEQLSAELQVTAPEVKHSPFMPSPCLAGIRKPSILLPADDLSLPMRDVLIHELAHLRRYDCHWNLLRQLATAIFFYQPLLWLLSRRVETTAEEVCDDFVVQLGGDRIQYAHCLADIAELSTARVAPVGVGMFAWKSMLGKRVSRIMDTSRTISTRVGNLLLVLVLAGGLIGITIAGLVGLSEQPVEAKAAVTSEIENGFEDERAGDQKTEEETKSKDATDDQPIVLRGKVVGADGKPISKATVRVVGWRPAEQNPLSETTSGPDGEFEISYKLSQLQDNFNGATKVAYIAAFKKGHGPQWIKLDASTPNEELQIKLPADNVPIVGHLADLEGQPLAGIKISIGGLATPKKGDLTQWLEAVEDGQSIGEAYQLLRTVPFEGTGLPNEVITDANGKFQLAGVGRDRKVDLLFEGPTIARTTITAVTRDIQAVAQSMTRIPQWANDAKRRVLGADFKATLEPTRIIQGIVRDAETRKPLAGVAVHSWQFAGTHTIGEKHIHVLSDDQGRFRLVGMPKGKGNQIVAIPNDEQCYFMRVADVVDEPGMEPVAVNLELHRGIWISGRVTDQATGEPIDGARLQYLPFLTNEFVQALPEFHSSGNVDGTNAYQDRYKTDKDGRFRLVGMPGRAIIGVLSIDNKYRLGVGADDIEGMDDKGQFETFRNPIWPSKRWPSAMKEINPDANAKTVSVDLELVPGEQIEITTQDQDGIFLPGVKVNGIWMNAATFTTTELGDQDPTDRPGAMTFHHEQRNLGKVVRFGNNKRSKRMSVRLEPCAHLVGSLVDGDGLPIANALVRLNILHARGSAGNLPTVRTNDQGRFDHPGVLPGAEYSVAVQHEQMNFEMIAEKLKVVKPGEIIDLGTIDLASKRRPVPIRTPANRVESYNTQRSKSDTTISGRVVGADGKLVAGAKFYWFRSWAHDLNPMSPILIATSDKNGNYSFESPGLGLPADEPARWAYDQWIVVRAPGHGMSIERPGNLARIGSMVGLPAAGKPLKGRIVDVNGQGVAGARIRIRRFQEFEPTHPRTVSQFASLDSTARSETPVDYHEVVTRLIQSIEPVQFLDVFPNTTTDAEGRFEIRDPGQRRLFHLLAEGENIESTEFLARNEAGEKLDVVNEFYSKGDTYTLHPREILLVAGPSKPVVGKVIDYDSKQPIANAIVEGHQERRLFNAHAPFLTRTDDEGNYRITGLPSGKANRIVAWSDEGELPYAALGSRVNTATADTNEVTQDLALKQGVWIEGRVFDSDTNKPLTGSVEGFCFRDPEFESKFPGIRYIHSYNRRRFWTNLNGEFRLPALQTRGVIAYYHEPASHEEAMNPVIDLPRGAGAEKIAGINKQMHAFETWPYYLQIANHDFFAEINPTSDDKTLRVDLPLVASPEVKIKIVTDNQTAPNEFMAYGARAKYGWQPIDTLEPQVKALKAGERRKVFVFHRKSNRVGSAIVEATDNGPIQIKLQPAGKIRGRLVDPHGEPMSGAEVISNYDKLRDEDDSAMWAPHPERRSNPTRIKADADGRFELTGIIPGWKYSARVSAVRRMGGRMQDTIVGRPFNDVTIESGETKDLGDLVVDVNR